MQNIYVSKCNFEKNLNLIVFCEWSILEKNFDIYMNI